MDYVNLVELLVKPLVANPDTLSIKIVDDGKGKTVQIVAERKETAQIIGHRGATINSVRDIVNIAARLNRQHVRVSVRSTDEVDQSRDDHKN